MLATHMSETVPKSMQSFKYIRDFLSCVGFLLHIKECKPRSIKQHHPSDFTF
jgi:hypothetical protein